MKFGLLKLIGSAIVKELFPTPEKKMERRIIRTGDRLYKGIVIRLNTGKEQAYSPYHRKDLLHRRLRQYQRVRRHGSNAEKVAALAKLQKEWRKFMRDYNGNFGERKGRVLPMKFIAR